MEWKFRKEFQVMPGVKLSYGKTGITTQVTHLNSIHDQTLELEKIKHQVLKLYDKGDEIKSASISQLTSKNLKEFKELLLVSNNNYDETNAILTLKENEWSIKQLKAQRLGKSIFRVLFRKKIERLKANVDLLKEEICELQKQLSLSVVSMEIDTDEIYHEQYRTIEKTFRFLETSVKKWDFTSSKRNNMVAERTSAAHSVTRSDIEVSFKGLPIIISEKPPMCFHNINGGNIYFYPGFIIVYENKHEFALISYTDIEVAFNKQRFIEQETIPSDSKIVGQTWHKVNKDGSPDRRFTGNFQIPIMEYGQISFKSNAGLNELYCFSNMEYTMLFERALSEYISSLKTADALLKEFGD